MNNHVVSLTGLGLGLSSNKTEPWNLRPFTMNRLIVRKILLSNAAARHGGYILRILGNSKKSRFTLRSGGIGERSSASESKGKKAAVVDEMPLF